MINCGFANGRVDGVYADAVITATYLGIRGVDVLCQTLVGDINPSGKTVDTYAKVLEDYPSYKSFHENKDFANYYEDIYVGYRYFETFNVDVDYPFGYGLSYTTFDISDVTYTEGNGKITVTAKVTNTGGVAGKEVLQVYFCAPQREAAMPFFPRRQRNFAALPRRRFYPQVRAKFSPSPLTLTPWHLMTI